MRRHKLSPGETRQRWLGRGFISQNNHRSTSPAGFSFRDTESNLALLYCTCDGFVWTGSIIGKQTSVGRTRSVKLSSSTNGRWGIGSFHLMLYAPCRSPKHQLRQGRDIIIAHHRSSSSGFIAVDTSFYVIVRPETEPGSRRLASRSQLLLRNIVNPTSLTIVSELRQTAGNIGRFLCRS